jgi:hypothetical protein
MPLWQGLFLSLGLDLLIPYVAAPRMPLSIGFDLASLCALMTLPFIDQQRAHSTLSRLRVAHKKGLSASSKTTPVVIGAVALLVIVAKSITLAGGAGIIPALVIIVMLGATAKHLRAAYREGIRDQESLRSNAWANVRRWEHQVVIVSLVPMLTARAIGLCGALSMFPSEDPVLRAVFSGTSLVLLLILKPYKPFFLGSCARCKQPVPIVISDLGSCLGCDEDLREKFLSRSEK